MMRRVAIVLSCVLASAAALPAGAQPNVVAGPLRSPESAAWHAESGTWFISNMGGVSFDLGDEAGNGFVTRVLSSGVVVGHWMTSLDRPRGLAVSDSHLFAAERDTVAVGEILSARVIERITVPGANGDLNGLVYDPETDTLFASSPSAGAIFSIVHPTSVAPVVEVFAQGPELTQPNGLTLEPGFVVSAGLGLNSPTGLGGKVVRVDRISNEVEAVTATGLGALDGIVKDGDDYLVTDWLTGNLYRIARDGSVMLEFKFAPGAADIGFDPVARIVMVPEMLANVAVAVPLL